MGLAMLVLAACSSAEPADDVPSATVPTAPATTTTTDPYAVPAVIDEAYVNRVLAGLDAAVGDVVRMVVRTRTIPREGVQRLKAVYGTDAQLDQILDSLSRDVARGLPGYRTDPGNKLTLVTELVATSGSCIFAKVERDFNAVSANPVPNAVHWVVLKPRDANRDPDSINAVGWVLVYEGFEEGRKPPVNPCA